MEKTCPFGHKCEKCLLQTTLRGINPQTGAEVDNIGCALAFIPILLVENSNQQRQVGAAVESFRNEMVQGNNMMLLERMM
jgi:hypothetical protein